MGREKLIPNTKINKLTVVGDLLFCLNKNYKFIEYVKCDCECGNTRYMSSEGIRKGRLISCGCEVQIRATKAIKELYNPNKHNIQIGDIFGKWTVIDLPFLSIEKKDNICLCRCSCADKTEKLVDTYSLVTGDSKSCGSPECRNKKGSNHHNWKGVGEISGTHIAGIKRHARDRNIQYVVSDEYIWQKFLSQNRKCALTGKLLIFATTWDDYAQTASLDRIDSSKGYIEGNIEWVHKDVNMMKIDYSKEEFIQICNAVFCRHPRINNTSYEEKSYLEKKWHIPSTDDYTVLLIKGKIDEIVVEDGSTVCEKLSQDYINVD